MATTTFEIMFNNLNEETQKELLEFEGVKSPSDCNYEITPICILEKTQEEEVG